MLRWWKKTKHGILPWQYIVGFTISLMESIAQKRVAQPHLWVFFSESGVGRLQRLCALGEGWPDSGRRQKGDNAFAGDFPGNAGRNEGVHALGGSGGDEFSAALGARCCQNRAFPLGGAFHAFREGQWYNCSARPRRHGWAVL